MIAQSVTDILRDHVKLSAGRASTGRISMFMCLGCKTEQGIVWFVRQHRASLIPSAVLMGPMSRSFVAAL